MEKKYKDIIATVSSRNNYDMVEGEVLKRLPIYDHEFINVDDNSDHDEQLKGKRQAEKHGFVYLQNHGRGVQLAMDTLINWVRENRPECRWVVCFQHDIFPLEESESDNWFLRLSNHLKDPKFDNVGLVGFNVLDKGKYTKNALDVWFRGGKPKGMIGMAHLAIRNNRERWLCPDRQPELIDHPGFDVPFRVEFPMWAAVAINVEMWIKHIQATEDYQFHLWLPDIAMQFNYKNIPSVILPDLYCLNDQELKAKYGINPNSAQGAMNGNERHFGTYGDHLINWKKRWGWDYENTATFEHIKSHYLGTLIEKYYVHDISNGPLKF